MGRWGCRSSGSVSEQLLRLSRKRLCPPSGVWVLRPGSVSLLPVFSSVGGGVFHHHPWGPSLSLRSGFAHPPDLEPQSDGCVPSLGKRAIKSFISDSGSPRRALSSLEDKRGFSLEPTPKVQRSWGWEGSPESLSRAGFPPPPPPPGVPVATERQVSVQNKRGRAVSPP